MGERKKKAAGWVGIRVFGGVGVGGWLYKCPNLTAIVFGGSRPRPTAIRPGGRMPPPTPIFCDQKIEQRSGRGEWRG